MSNWIDYTKDAVLAAAAQNPAQFGLQGRPTTGEVDAVYFNFNDFVSPFVAPAPLATLRFSIQMFQRDLGSGFARNVRLPLASARAFYAFQKHINIFYKVSTAESVDPGIEGQDLDEALFIATNATKMRVNVDQKEQYNNCIEHFANYTVPSIVRGLTGQTAPAPFTPFGQGWPEHHRAGELLDPPIVWTVVGDVAPFLEMDVQGFWKDLTGAALDPQTRPGNFLVQPFYRVTYSGVLVRNIK